MCNTGFWRQLYTAALVSTPAPQPPFTIHRTISNLRQLACLSLGRRHRLDVEHGAQQVLDHLVLVLLASRLDLLDVGLGLLVRLLLGLLVSLGVLEPFARAVSHAPSQVRVYRVKGSWRIILCVPRALRPYLGLELLVLLLLGRPVLFYLLLGLVTGLLDTLRPVLSGCAPNRSRSAQLARVGALGVGRCSWGFRTLLDDLGGVFLGL